ncbi:hypothetical protein EJB05_27775, partial [Eragrostis curvula]
NVISFMTYLAPLPTFYRIHKNKSTEGFQSIPYVVALFSAMLWIYYALLKSDECLLITINTAGCIIETIYIVVYLIYAPKKAKMFTVKILLLLNVGVFGLILVLTLLLAAGDNRVVVLGWVCVGFSVSVFVAPLSIIVLGSLQRQVVRTRSVEFMPFSLSLSLTFSAVVWFLYGLLIKDKYVALPNVLGFTFGVIQMGLYAFYRNATPRITAKEMEHDKEAPMKDVVKVSEHVVTIAKLGASAVELTMEPTLRMEAKQDNKRMAAEEEQQKVNKLGRNAEQV